MHVNAGNSQAAFAKPVPRQPKSQAKLAQIRVQNRRRQYLHLCPSYFTSLEHELADPILYERLIKRFQTPSEREAEGKAKGYGRTLEADLVRGETKLSNAKLSGESDSGIQSLAVTTGSGVDHEWEHEATSKEKGLLLWHAFIEERFIHGEDEDFDYARVDTNDEYDLAARNDAEDAWFDEEEPGWEAAGKASDMDVDMDKETDKETDKGTQRSPARGGETGVQDF